MNSNKSQTGLRILFQAREGILESNGGDAIQLKATRKHLEAHNVKIDFSSSHKVDYSAYDIVHLFNLTRPYSTLLQARNAAKHKKPICLSTIYWNMDELFKTTEQNVPYLRRTLRPAARLLRRFKAYFNEQAMFTYRELELMRSLGQIKEAQAEIISLSNILLPNSKIELAEIYQDFPEAKMKAARIVPNCIDSKIFHSSRVQQTRLDYLEDIPQFVLCAGRLEKRKNQVNVLKAMKDTSIPVILVGRHGSNRKYIDEIHEAMSSKDRIFTEVPQHELRNIYAAARVHVLASYYETPGLSSLEAGAMGCNLVMSEVGSQYEYFGDRVEYCDIYSTESIRNAILHAWEKPWPNVELENFVHTNYTWEVAAQETLTAYHRVRTAVE